MQTTEYSIIRKIYICVYICVSIMSTIDASNS